MMYGILSHSHPAPYLCMPHGYYVSSGPDLAPNDLPACRPQHDPENHHALPAAQRLSLQPARTHPRDAEMLTSAATTAVPDLGPISGPQIGTA